MSTRLIWLTILISAPTVGGCTDPSGLTFVDTRVLDAGYGSGGAAQEFGERLPQQFRYLYSANAPDCTTRAHCGLAGRATQVGNMSSGGQHFMFVSTANVPEAHPQGPRTIGTSGIRTYSGSASTEFTIPDPDQYKSLRLSLSWAFLTGRFEPAIADDSAFIRIRTDTDSAIVFSVRSSDLQTGVHPRKGGGCGTHTLVGRSITYNTCTDWRTAAVDITDWKSRSFVIQFIVTEAGPLVTGAQDEPTMFLFRNAIIEGGS